MVARRERGSANNQQIWGRRLNASERQQFRLAARVVACERTANYKLRRRRRQRGRQRGRAINITKTIMYNRRMWSEGGYIARKIE